MSAKIVQFRETPDEQVEQPAPVRLNLGCNQRPIEGCINVDIHPFEGVDVVADLEKRWPWEDGSVDIVQCADLPEHIRMWWESPDWSKYQGTFESFVDVMKNPVRTYGIIHFMNEAHRVLKTGGILDMLIPSTDARGWAQDPTHVSYWNENSILYFTDKTYYGLYPHLITARFKPIKVATTVKNPLDISWVHAVLEKV